MNSHHADRSEGEVAVLLSLTGTDAVPPDDDALDRVSAATLAAFESASSQSTGRKVSCRRWRLPGNLLMKHRIFTIGIPAAVAAAVVLVVGLWPQPPGPGVGGSSGRVYGAADIPELFSHVKVYHVHQWFYGPSFMTGTADMKRRKTSADYWLDTTNGRWRMWSTDLGLTDGTEPPADIAGQSQRVTGSVSDGEYVMELWYDAPLYREQQPIRKIGNYTRLTPFMTMLEIANHYPSFTTDFVKDLENPENASKYAQVGRELLDGHAYNIWQRDFDFPRWDPEAGELRYDEGRQVRYKVWVSPTTGDVERVEVWLTGPATDHEWMLNEVTDLIEYGATPPPGIFDTVPPPGYEMSNTKATAPLRSISEECHQYGADSVELRVHMQIHLNDGSILVGWSSRDEDADESQVPLFEDLTPGGPLPALPIQVRSFDRRASDPGPTYTGRHLAWTQKNGRCYEWAIYVPSRKLTLSDAGWGGRYRLDYVLNTDSTTVENVGPLFFQSVGARIYPAPDATEFNKWALGAMADLSDGGIVPEYVTYEYVMDLCDQIRASLQAR